MLGISYVPVGEVLARSVLLMEKAPGLLVDSVRCQARLPPNKSTWSLHENWKAHVTPCPFGQSLGTLRLVDSKFT
jgi:hypothetical protein